MAKKNKNKKKSPVVQKPKDTVELTKKTKKLDPVEEIQEPEFDDWKKPKEIAQNALYGIFMGISDGIPGYSGGTTLNIIGFYEKLISNLKNIFKPKNLTSFWKHLLWFIPFGITWVLTLIGFMLIVSQASKTNNAIILVFLFASFAFFSIPIFFIANKKKMHDFTKIIPDLKNKNKNAITAVILFAIGFIILLVIALVVRFVSQTQLVDSTIVRGVTFAKEDYENEFLTIFQNKNLTNDILLFLFAGFLSGFCMLIPGISGSLVTYMFGIYPKLSWCVSNLFNSNLFNNTTEFNNFSLLPFIILFIVSVIVGIVASSLLINWLLKKHETNFMSFSFGLVACSFLSILISLSPKDYQTLNDINNVIGAIMMIVLAIVLNGSLFIWLNETNKIDYPKYKIKNLFNKSAK